MILTVKGFNFISEVEIDLFLEFSRFLYNPVDVGSLIKDVVFLLLCMVEEPLEPLFETFS